MPAFLLVFIRFFRAIREGLNEPEFRALFLTVLVVLGSGTWFYHQAEGWSWLDALYFTVVTLTTIGYGDLHPTTPASKIFTIFWFFGFKWGWAHIRPRCASVGGRSWCTQTPCV